MRVGGKRDICAHTNLFTKTYKYLHFQLQYKREKSEVARNI